MAHITESSCEPRNGTVTVPTYWKRCHSHWSAQEMVALTCGAFISRACDLNLISYSAGVCCCLCLPGSTLPPWGKSPSNSAGEVSLPVSNLGKPDNQGATISLAIQSAYSKSRADDGFPAWFCMLRDPNCSWFVSSVLPWQCVVQHLDPQSYPRLLAQ